MYRFSNTLISFLNLFPLLALSPIIGGGLWMARSSTTCENFLQTPLPVIDFAVLVISLVGFIGACFHVAWVVWVYLVVMLFLIATLLGSTIFGFIVTSQGGGHASAWQGVQRVQARGLFSLLVGYIGLRILTEDN
ncbi:Tetraspanin-6 [Turnera subulata]|uniref:Tetraspanin-6 n=1 Tax=Turnera subulata TaxID=218843 RepID=A0A9Q0JNN2_9ROSI|nr:Tetraspanin-6 [Turnera subulata]